MPSGAGAVRSRPHPCATVTPRLIVLLVFDQMRADYIDNFSSQWTAGLRRLLAEGASFRQVEYPYFDTLTCPGHSTIATGTLPATHRMVLNVWWDPRKAAEVRCTQDDRTRFVSYGRAVRGSADSAANLQVATLADQLRAQSSPRARIDPARAAFRSFDALWEFVAGPLNAGSFGPNALDGTFGPQVVFFKAPPPGQANLSPFTGLQFFGEVNIAAYSGDMTVDLRDINGVSVFTKRLLPRMY